MGGSHASGSVVLEPLPRADRRGAALERLAGRRSPRRVARVLRRRPLGGAHAVAAPVQESRRGVRLRRAHLVEPRPGGLAGGVRGTSQTRGTGGRGGGGAERRAWRA